MEPQRHILVVLPHPDDETGIAGTLACHIRNGTPVTYVCMTMGEMGRNMGIPPFANRVTLPGIRRKELDESCRAIGIQDLRLLGLHDKTVEFEPTETLADRIHAIVADVNPSLVITFYPGYSVHPDHDACGAAVIRAIKRIPPDKRPAVHCIAFAKGCEEALGKPDILNEIGACLEQKITSFQAHKSQFQHFMTAEGRPEFLSETERFWTYRF